MERERLDEFVSSEGAVSTGNLGKYHIRVDVYISRTNFMNIVTK